MRAFPAAFVAASIIALSGAAWASRAVLEAQADSPAAAARESAMIHEAAAIYTDLKAQDDGTPEAAAQAANDAAAEMAAEPEPYRLPPTIRTNLPDQVWLARLRYEQGVNEILRSDPSPEVLATLARAHANIAAQQAQADAEYLARLAPEQVEAAD